MTDEPDDVEEPPVDGYMVVSDVGRAPRGYSYTVKLLLAYTAAVTSSAFAALAFYIVFQLGPTSKSNAEVAQSNADALTLITQRTETEKAQDACYDQYSADITEGNAGTLAALAEDDASIGVLVVLLAAQPRDPRAEQAAIERIGAASTQALTAASEYAKAIDARDAYAAAGKPLPCTHDQN